MERPYLSSVSMAGMERIAAEIMSDDAHAYYMTGAGDEVTLRANEAAWRSWFFLPGILTDTTALTTEVTLLGAPAGSPVMIAPMAAQRLAHPDGELATARAAAAGGHVVVLSMNSTESIEDVAAVPGCRVWLQLYVTPDRGHTRALVERAASAGAEAIVLTVDAVVDRPVHRRPHGPLGLPSTLSFPMNDGSELDPGITWRSVEELVADSPVPVVLKGVMRPEDAQRAAAAGCAAVIVSNHGGRQLDGELPTADALTPVADLVGEQLEVYVDGGIRSGGDVLRALALGARAVLVGRPVIWGLAAGGEAGVARVLGILNGGLLDDARQCGITRLDRVPRELVRLSPTVCTLPPSVPVRGR